MPNPSLEKIEQFRRQLKSDWTRDETVAAWRKWHKQTAEFTRGATDALLAEANLQHGQHVLDLASGVGDPALRIGCQGPGTKRHANTGGRFARGDVEYMSGEGGQLAHRPTRSSGLTGARRRSRPVARRNAATTAAGTTTVDGSPTPFAP